MRFCNDVSRERDTPESSEPSDSAIGFNGADLQCSCAVDPSIVESLSRARFFVTAGIDCINQCLIDA